jgi:uncharacterized membrane protein (DUF485 family)
MLHEPAAKTGKDPAFAFKRRLGVILFFAYGAVYAGFIAVNLISPTLMKALVLPGQNLAVVYGFGLIVLALLLALIYNAACGKREAVLAKKEEA